MTRFIVMLAALILLAVAFDPQLVEAGWTVALFFAFIGFFMPKGAKEACFGIAAVAFAATFVGANYYAEIRTFAALAAAAGIVWLVASLQARRNRRQPQGP